MRKRTILVFILILSACASFLTCQNPVMERWWDGTETGGVSRNEGGNFVSTDFKVTFEPNGGTYIDFTDPVSDVPVPQSIFPGAKISDPGLVIKEPEFFAGWYENSNFSGSPWNFATDKVVKAANMTLYGRWESGEGYTVNFALNLSNGGDITEQNVSYQPRPELISAGAKVVEPLEFRLLNPLLNSSQYSFRGWYRDAKCTNLWNFAEDVVDADAASADDNGDGVVDINDDNTVLTLYAGWAKDGQPLPLTKNYVVTWVSNTNDTPTPKDQYLPEGAKIVAPSIMTRSSHTFNGWYTATTLAPTYADKLWDFASNKVKDDYADSPAVPGGTPGKITLHADWNVSINADIKVVFEMDGGYYIDLTPPFDAAPVTQTIKLNGKVSDPGLAVKNGSYLGGWYTTHGKEWNFAGDVVTNADLDDENSDPLVMTLRAGWSENGHTVKFDLNLLPGMTNKDVSYQPRDEYIAEGALAAQPLEFGVVPPQSGDSPFSFHGWYTEKSCTNLWNFMGAAADTVTEDITLYAKWETTKPLQEYQVIWDTGNAYDAPMPQYLIEGSKIVTPFTITNPGHAFVGWYTDANFTQQWDFATDTLPTPSAVNNSTRKPFPLYAKWIVPDMAEVVGMNMGDGEYYIGTDYTMGENAADPDDKYPNTGGTLHPKVKLSTFYIGKTEITNSKFRDVMGYVPSHWAGDTNPVDQVTWYDAVAFCNALSEKEKLTPYYDIANIQYIGSTRSIRSADVKISDKAATGTYFNDGYRLPTEAEWEYAARGGSSSANYKYAGSDNVEDVAWYDRNSASSTHPVGTKQPNELDIYDMSGNLSEWCWDWYDGKYYDTLIKANPPPTASTPNPTGPDSSSKNPQERVRRGGNWNMLDVRTRSRANNNPSTYSWPPGPADNDLSRYWTIGFRVARSVRRSP